MNNCACRHMLDDKVPYSCIAVITSNPESCAHDASYLLLSSRLYSASNIRGRTKTCLKIETCLAGHIDSAFIRDIDTGDMFEVRLPSGLTHPEANHDVAKLNDLPACLMNKIFRLLSLRECLRIGATTKEIYHEVKVRANFLDQNCLKSIMLLIKHCLRTFVRACSLC